ncbi:hypothetical protein EDM80_11030 [bacterium]|nr:MAG: hypothetical protein EDM80_11030 [bacterium]RIK63225.1 MAG: hypothetical protein DCC64_07995 [Planctomycetota bacterium]
MRNLLVLSLALNIFFLGGLGLAFGFPGTRATQAQTADEGKPALPSKEKQTSEFSPEQLVRLAGDLACWGRDNKHAGALAVASSILSSVKVKESKALEKKFSAEGEGSAITADSLLTEAKKMAGEGGSPFMEAIARLGMQGRGSTKGVLQARGTIAAAGKNEKGEAQVGAVVEKMTFTVGELAAIWVGGDGTTDLDLFIFDSTGKVLIASDTRPGDSCWVEWVPTESTYYIQIVNWGPKKNTFTIVLN